ncbi:hypothetical protein DES53_101517 [Roseimicrobium gellanilyticum]|uniref:Uncharacterized protein n=2 Tax=Roseimicrobium gellanilyticum TaxID=748857 RepID=A0A366HWN7_9BACT|nr:hypothetical protein DES53_101517 [Roseimicrobium gellanilyticum]
MHSCCLLLNCARGIRPVVAIAAALLLSSCTHVVKFDFKVEAESGAPKESDVRVSWNRVTAFRSAEARLLSREEHPKMARLDNGQNSLLIVSDGSVESRTANLLQYRTAIVCLPSELPTGTEMKLKWADYDSSEPLQPGEAAVRVKQFFSGQVQPKPGQAAGNLKILSVTGEKIRLQFDLVIELPKDSLNNRKEIGRLGRELEVERQQLKSPLVVRKYPDRANQEVGPLPRLGRMW